MTCAFFLLTCKHWLYSIVNGKKITRTNVLLCTKTWTEPWVGFKRL